MGRIESTAKSTSSLGKGLMIKNEIIDILISPFEWWYTKLDEIFRFCILVAENLLSVIVSKLYNSTFFGPLIFWRFMF